MSRKAYKFCSLVAAVAAILTATAGVLVGSPSRIPSRTRLSSAETSAATVNLDSQVASRLRRAVESAAKVEASLESFATTGSIFSESSDVYCISVSTLGGLALYQNGIDRPMTIASVTKVFTTTAALVALGPQWRFETKFVIERGSARSEKAADSAYFVGGGDPYLVSKEFEEFWRRESEEGPVTRLEELAESITQSGLEKIGTLYVDDSLYDSQFYPPKMPRSFVEQGLLPPVSALSVDRNLAEWDRNVGKPAFVSDPPIAAAKKLASALGRRGVSIGTVKRGIHSPRQSDQQEFVVRSAPLGELIRFVNAKSDNFAAEMLAKRVAASASMLGSWDGFWVRARQALDEIGVKVPRTHLEDGSGLSGNTSTCSDITSLLATVSRSPVGEHVLKSLATPGSPGTLEDRLSGVSGAKRLRAKTGRLQHVSALAGIVEVGSDSAVVFSVLTNGAGAQRSRAELEDPLVKAILFSSGN